MVTSLTFKKKKKYEKDKLDIPKLFYIILFERICEYIYIYIRLIYETIIQSGN